MSMIASIFTGTLASGDNPLTHVVAHPIYEWQYSLFGHVFHFTNHQFTMIVVGVVMLIAFLYVGAKARTNTIPSGLHNFFEAILSFLRTEVFRPALKENTDRFTPFLWTVFFFILFCNLLGMLPLGQIANIVTGGTAPHFWGTATGNWVVTGTLAIMTFLTIHIGGVSQQVRMAMDPSLDPHHHHGAHGHGDPHAHHGPEGRNFIVAVPVGGLRYLWNFAPHPETGIKVMDLTLWFGLLILEMLGALVKPFALCVRLFANMIAGHLILASLLIMIPFTVHGVTLYTKIGVSIPIAIGSAALSILEVFVCFLQAYIFTFLTTLFIGSAVAPEH